MQATEISRAEQIALQASLLPKRARITVTTGDCHQYRGKLLTRTDYDIEVLVNGRELRFPYKSIENIDSVPSWYTRNIASLLGL